MLGWATYSRYLEIQSRISVKTFLCDLSYLCLWRHF